MSGKEQLLNQDPVGCAYNLAKKLHEGQFRQSGKPYFSHCEGVTNILIDWGIKNKNTLSCSYLHDLVEDGKITLDKIKSLFGENVAEIIDGVTKLKSDTDKQAIQKVFDKTYIHPNIAIIKLADRLHNMRTLEFMPKEKIINKARETLNVYVPLANSLGMWEVKGELEDNCFKWLEEEEYQKIDKEIKNDPRSTMEFREYVSSGIRNILQGFNFYLNLKENGRFFIKEKQRRLNLDIKNINDFISFRIITDKEENLFKIMGKIVNKWSEYVRPDESSLYIGYNKRPNGYEAIQLNLIFKQGPIEIAIATKKQEDFNKWGIISLINNNVSEEEIKKYILKPVFTNDGQVRFLPKGATVADFINNPRKLAEANSAIVDGQETTLSHVLLPNSTVEKIIYGDPRRAPLPGIENFVLPINKHKIEELREQERIDRIILLGKEKMRQILSSRGFLDFRDIHELHPEIVSRIIYNYGQNRDDLYHQLGNGNIKNENLKSILDKYKITKKYLKYTTIEICGQDQKNLMKLIISKIDANIVRTIQTSNLKYNTFYFRQVIHNLTKKQEEKLKKEYLSSTNFTSTLIV